MGPNVLERELNAVPTLKDGGAVAEKEDVLEYGHASLNFFPDRASACASARSVGQDSMGGDLKSESAIQVLVLYEGAVAER